METNSLQGQVAIISGALGDLGSAIALGLAKHGADIALGDLADSGEGLKKQIESLGRKVCYHKVDVSNADQVQAWVSHQRQQRGGLRCRDLYRYWPVSGRHGQYLCAFTL